MNILPTLIMLIKRRQEKENWAKQLNEEAETFVSENYNFDDNVVSVKKRKKYMEDK